VSACAPLVRVNGVAPATVVQGSAMFPRDRVIGSLAKYNIAYTEAEDTESLRTKLANFYAVHPVLLSSCARHCCGTGTAPRARH
jgi:hypothetical protein